MMVVTVPAFAVRVTMRTRAAALAAAVRMVVSAGTLGMSVGMPAAATLAAAVRMVVSAGTLVMSVGMPAAAALAAAVGMVVPAGALGMHGRTPAGGSLRESRAVGSRGMAAARGRFDRVK